MRRPASAENSPRKLKRDRKFQPCPSQAGDEIYPNGIFAFNITRLLAFIAACPQRFPVGSIAVTDIPKYGSDDHLDEEAIRAADLSRPILLAEIAPEHYNLIDGHHRVARARREGTPILPAHRVRCPHHIPFLTTMKAYESYLEYWNSKVRDWSPPQESSK